MPYVLLVGLKGALVGNRGGFDEHGALRTQRLESAREFSVDRFVEARVLAQHTEPRALQAPRIQKLCVLDGRALFDGSGRRIGRIVACEYRQ
jgi:hypothetical protein